MSYSPPYTHDVIQVIRLGKYYQVKYLSSVRLSGFEENIPGFGDDLEPLKTYTEIKNDHKLSNNISRAISTCRNIALSNEWDYFITLTLDPQKYNRYDLVTFHNDLSKFFKKINRKYNCKIRYLLVPEQHKNGAWHIHGLIADIPTILLDHNKNGFLDFKLYSNNFGYCSIDPVISHIAISLYITKHLSKQIYNGVIDRGEHLYYCSRGLNRGILIKKLRRFQLPDNFHFQYESEDGFYKSSFFEDNTFLKHIGLL